ncbi:hypothetical protein [Pedobacter agri]|uniref:hypothetical protein n=1 Tax=Pedobacter agri TaxID=454586 RepID=UPI00293080C3|nr:hypothetical protein [Pedobacter agri]
MKLIKHPHGSGHVSQDTVNEFEDIIVRDEQVSIISVAAFKIFLSKIFVKLVSKKILQVPKSLFQKRNEKLFCIMLGDEFHKSALSFLTNKNNNTYFFDAWPNNHKIIETFIKNFKVKKVFFSSQQVTEIFHNKGLDCNFFWIPEAVNTENYLFKPYSEKDIDVLSFGRKYSLLHDRIVEGLKISNINYLYEKTPGQIVFNSREDFIDGLSRTKISICIPSNITHPERSGDISTMTVRYLQSMASKCLILGYIPLDMQNLFDYNPIIEIDMDNPLKQIKDILNNFETYLPLIEKNYAYIMENHSWTHRWLMVKDIINKV